MIKQSGDELKGKGKKKELMDILPAAPLRKNHPTGKIGVYRHKAMQIVTPLTGRHTRMDQPATHSLTK